MRAQIANTGGRKNKVDGDFSYAFGNNVVVPHNYTAAFFSEDHPGKLGINNPTPNSTLQFDGSMATKFLRRSTDIDLSAGTIGEENFTILADAPITVTLPNATTCEGRIYAIRNISTGSVTVTVADDGYIESISSMTIPDSHGIIVQSEGTANYWWVIATVTW